MEIKKFIFLLNVWLLGCTCCCCDDSVDLLHSASGPASQDGVVQSVFWSEVSSQEPEYSAEIVSHGPREAQAQVSPTMEIIAHTMSLGASTNGDVGVENLPLDGDAIESEAKREGTSASEKDGSLEPADQVNGETNNTKESSVSDQTGTTDKNVEAEVSPQKGKIDEGTLEILKDNAVPITKGQPAKPVEGATLKKEGEESSEEDRKESSEKMPTFVEWKQKMLAEHEKGGEQVLDVRGTPPKKKAASPKSRRNYGSYECGAKVLAANSEADGAGRVLNEQMDEYMLNPCKAKIWFVVELCEMIQVSQVDIANFELFSSMPKEFAVSVSDRYPTREWVPLGLFTALDQKTVQTFKLQSEAYGKYIKVELISKYGSEHYCPLSLFRVFGTSMLDDYEQLVEKPQDPSQQNAEEDEEEKQGATEKQASKNVVDRAKDAVLSILKVLRRDQDGDSVDAVGSTPCSDLNSNCSIVNVSRQLPNTTRQQQQRCHPPSFRFNSVFQPCTVCSHFMEVPGVAQTLGETSACRFLRAALGPEEDCLLNKPSTEEEFPGIVASDMVHRGSSASASNADPASTTRISPMDSSDGASAVSSSPSATGFEAESPSVVTATSSIDDKTQTQSVKSSCDAATFADVAVASSVEQSSSEGAQTSVCENATAVEDFSTDELRGESKDREPATLLQSSSFATDVKPQSTTAATPAMAEVPTSVSMSPVDVPVDGTEKVTVAEGVSSRDTPASVSVLPAELENSLVGAGVAAGMGNEEGITSTTPMPHDDLAVEADSQLREATTIRPPTLDMAALSGNQKESVFMRINNRIKALELNMSLSGQYLEELSRRYRRQMDDMQRAFNRTIGALNETAYKAAEQDLRQHEALVHLQQQLENVTQVVDSLLAERQTLSRQVFESHVCLILIEVIVLATVFSLCLRRGHHQPVVVVQEPMETDRVTFNTRTPVSPSRVVLKRRSASAGKEQRIQEFITVAEKKKKPSTEALGDKNNFLIVEPVVPIMIDPLPPKENNEKAKKVSKKNKKKAPRRKASLPILNSQEVCRAPDKLKSSAGVLFNGGRVETLQAAKNLARVPEAPTITEQGPNLTRVQAQRCAPNGTEHNGPKSGSGRQSDCVRWKSTSGYSCCDTEERLGVIKFLRLPGKTPV